MKSASIPSFQKQKPHSLSWLLTFLSPLQLRTFAHMKSPLWARITHLYSLGSAQMSLGSQASLVHLSSVSSVDLMKPCFFSSMAFIPLTCLALPCRFVYLLVSPVQSFIVLLW